jgi:nucleolysin TIA-1/TIAR
LEKYPSIAEARVMWDTTSLKSRGYGFVAFSDIDQAKAAINQMQGVVVGSRPIRLNWASQKSETATTGNRYHKGGANESALDYNQVVLQTGSYNTTVYIGNLNPATTGI